jgi:hypothetical protein
MRSMMIVGSTLTFTILDLTDGTRDRCFAVKNQQSHYWDCCQCTSWFRSPLLLLLGLSLFPSYLEHLVLDAAFAPMVSTWHTSILCPFPDLDAFHVVIAAVVACRVHVISIGIRV